MPAPWLSDPTKDATLQALVSSLTPDQVVHAETAWNMVRGQSGFTNIDSTDDLCYVRYNWPGLAGQSLLAKSEKKKETPKEAPKKSDHHSHS